MGGTAFHTNTAQTGFCSCVFCKHSFKNAATKRIFCNDPTYVHFIPSNSYAPDFQFFDHFPFFINNVPHFEKSGHSRKVCVVWIESLSRTSPPNQYSLRNTQAN